MQKIKIKRQEYKTAKREYQLELLAANLCFLKRNPQVLYLKLVAILGVAVLPLLYKIAATVDQETVNMVHGIAILTVACVLIRGRALYNFQLISKKEYRELIKRRGRRIK